MGIIRVLLAESHRWVRQGLRDILECSGDIVVLAEAEGVLQMLQQIRDLHPDVAVLDYHLRGTLNHDAIRRVRDTSPNTRILVLVGDEAVEYQSLATLGVDGCLPKTSELAEMQTAVRNVFGGQAIRCIRFQNRPSSISNGV